MKFFWHFTANALPNTILAWQGSWRPANLQNRLYVGKSWKKQASVFVTSVISEARAGLSPHNLCSASPLNTKVAKYTFKRANYSVPHGSHETIALPPHQKVH